MRVVLLLALAAGGCAFDPGGAPLGGDGGDDAPDARRSDAGCDCALGCGADGTTCLSFDPSNLDDFALLDGDDLETLALSPGSWTLDTDAGTLRDPGNATVPDLRWTTRDGDPEIQVLALDRLDVMAAATLRVVGHRALVILADGPIVIDGTIELVVGCATDSPEDRDRVWCGGPGGGDGAHPGDEGTRIVATGCAPGGDGDAGATRNERGGGGGGFGTLGGHGGGRDGNGTDSDGGGACGTIVLEPLRGGSGGGGAGYVASANDDSRTSGGGGGGALQLTSRDAVVVRGVIDAPGGGGAGTAQVLNAAIPGGDGGGGGGSGGALLFEAPTVRFESSAIVTAHGGGGGAGLTLDRPGQRGQRARVRALGGANDDTTTGGFGAIGATDGEEASDGDDPGDGGSGGGGGAGRIHTHARDVVLDSSAIVSPAHSESPLLAI